VVVSAGGLPAHFCIAIYSFFIFCWHFASTLLALCWRFCWHFASTLLALCWQIFSSIYFLSLIYSFYACVLQAWIVIDDL
jgi:hypothetical protein